MSSKVGETTCHITVGNCLYDGEYHIYSTDFQSRLRRLTFSFNTALMQPHAMVDQFCELSTQVNIVFSTLLILSFHLQHLIHSTCFVL